MLTEKTSKYWYEKHNDSILHLLVHSFRGSYLLEQMKPFLVPDYHHGHLKIQWMIFAFLNDLWDSSQGFLDKELDFWIWSAKAGNIFQTANKTPLNWMIFTWIKMLSGQAYFFLEDSV